MVLVWNQQSSFPTFSSCTISDNMDFSISDALLCHWTASRVPADYTLHLPDLWKTFFIQFSAQAFTGEPTWPVPSTQGLTYRNVLLPLLVLTTLWSLVLLLLCSSVLSISGCFPWCFPLFLPLWFSSLCIQCSMGVNLSLIVAGISQVLLVPGYPSNWNCSWLQLNKCNYKVTHVLVASPYFTMSNHLSPRLHIPVKGATPLLRLYTCMISSSIGRWYYFFRSFPQNPGNPATSPYFLSPFEWQDTINGICPPI